MTLPRRPLGTTGVELSPLGFGCMRLPVRREGDKEVIDREEAIRIIRLGIDLGINYVDTAYMYHHGESEEVVGLALKDGWREKVYLSTKLPLWEMEGPDDFERLLDTQMERLGSPIDFYHMHMVNRAWFHERVLGWKLMERMEKARADGRIRFFSFSFHDEPEVLREVIDSGLFVSMLVQFNLIDRALEGPIEHAAAKGMGVMVMGPVGGGRLAVELPGVAEHLPPGLTLPELALRFVLARPEVSCVLSGMGSEAMVRANCAAAAAADPLAGEIAAAAEAVSEHLAGLKQIPCTECGYCTPCPQEVNIPLVLKLYNDYLLFGKASGSPFRYTLIGGLPTFPGKSGQACTRCGECLERCPQRIAIPDRLAQAHTDLAPKK